MTIPYWVAKYIPDVLRMEPVNVGVFALHEGWVFSRFLGESGAAPNLDLRKIRGVVQHTGTYRQWIEYWKYLISSSESPEAALDAVLSSAKGNYSVSKGADLVLANDSDISGEEITAYLFNLIVTEFTDHKNDELSLTERCAEIIRDFRLNYNPNFRIGPLIACRVNQAVTEQIQPTYAYINGAETYFQKVILNPARPEVTQKDVHNAAWIFSLLKERNPNCATNALVKLSGAEQGAGDFLSVLKSMSSDIVNVDDDAQVHRVFSAYQPH